MLSRYVRQMRSGKRETLQRRLAIAYGIIAWNGFAICLYYIFKQDKEKSDLSPGLYQAAMSQNIESTKVIRFDGLSYVDTTDYKKEEIDEARNAVKNSRRSEYRTDDF